MTSCLNIHLLPLPALLLLLFLLLLRPARSNHDARRLYDDLLRKNRYNRLIRPVGNSTDKLTVKMGLKLAQVLDVNERTQVITTNLWVVQEWKDQGLRWEPMEYGGVKTLYVPSESIWLPDIVLYNNADGDYTVTIMTKATLSYNGTVRWEPPVIYKSHCEIEVEFFPFDIQHCRLKFGSWSYDGFQVDLVHLWQEHLGLTELAKIDEAIDLNDFYRSVEWDLLNVPAKKTIKKYPCCAEPYPDITFSLTLRRKTLFYTINLLIPCISINVLTILGFYLPSDGGEKISLCISILLSLSIFQLLLMEIVPATSLTIPLMGKYILFTSCLLSLSIFSSVVTLNVNFRSMQTPEMPALTKRLFLHVLPKLLCMRQPPDNDEGHNAQGQKQLVADFSEVTTELPTYGKRSRQTTFSMSIDSNSVPSSQSSDIYCPGCEYRRKQLLMSSTMLPPNATKALEGATFIAKHLHCEDEAKKVKDEWKYVALVIDRILLVVYASVCVLGGGLVLLRAPALYDYREPLTSNSDIFFNSPTVSQ